MFSQQHTWRRASLPGAQWPAGTPARSGSLSTAALWSASLRRMMHQYSTTPSGGKTTPSEPGSRRAGDGAVVMSAQERWLRSWPQQACSPRAHASHATLMQSYSRLLHMHANRHAGMPGGRPGRGGSTQCPAHAADKRCCSCQLALDELCHRRNRRGCQQCIS